MNYPTSNIRYFFEDNGFREFCTLVNNARFFVPTLPNRCIPPHFAHVSQSAHLFPRTTAADPLSARRPRSWRWWRSSTPWAAPPKGSPLSWPVRLRFRPHAPCFTAFIDSHPHVRYLVFAGYEAREGKRSVSLACLVRGPFIVRRWNDTSRICSLSGRGATQIFFTYYFYLFSSFHIVRDFLEIPSWNGTFIPSPRRLPRNTPHIRHTNIVLSSVSLSGGKPHTMGKQSARWWLARLMIRCEHHLNIFFSTGLLAPRNWHPWPQYLPVR